MLQFLADSRSPLRMLTLEGSSMGERDVLVELLERVRRTERRVRRVERLLEGQQPAKKYYTTAEFGRLCQPKMLKPYTVREHCRLGRIRAERRACGRGNSPEYSIPHAELGRYNNEGLLPDRRRVED